MSAEAKASRSTPPVGPGGVDEPGMFKQLDENVTTARITLGNVLQEYLHFNNELMQHQLPSNLLLSLTLTSSRLFRSYSDLCTPLGELCRLTALHSSPWEKKAESLKKTRSDYESMQRRLSIALKRLEMMSVEASRTQHHKMLGHWERLFCHVMQAKSHGRRWKFRIAPLRRKIKAGYNPYLSDSESDQEEELEEEEEEALFDSTASEQSSKTPEHVENRERTLEEHTATEQVPSHETTPPPPPVEKADAATSTADPSFDNYLLVQLSRPSNILPKKDICCSISLGQEFYTSEVFPGKPQTDTPKMGPQMFHFPLTEAEASALPPTGKDSSSTKLLIGVYPRNISSEMSASLGLPLTAIKTTDDATVIVPPEFRGEEFKLEWDKISEEVSGTPVHYPLTLMGEGPEEDEEEEIPSLPIICHRVKVQRHHFMESSSLTLPWEELMEELGYRKIAETQSRAASALPFDPAPLSPLPPEEVGPTVSEVRTEVERESREMLETLSLEHMRELKQLQHQYEAKLNSLSTTLAKVKAEKNREIQDLEHTLTEMEKIRATGKKGRSVADIQQAIARRRKRLTQGLPDWGKDLPDFFERLVLFKEESIRKQEELIDRIRKEVSEACEKQLATLHRLAPTTGSNMNNTTEDVTLPALFMPTSITKHLVFTPRAHQYFHPPGSHDNRVTQPPAIFKLPALQPGLQTLNLFELSQHFVQTGPHWLKESGRPLPSPLLTPAPPPSACGYYRTHHGISVATEHAKSAVIAEEDQDSELDYGGLVGGATGKVRVHYDRQNRAK